MSGDACDVAVILTGMMLGAGFVEFGGAWMVVSMGRASGAALLGFVGAKTGLGRREAFESGVYSQDGEGSIVCLGDRSNA